MRQEAKERSRENTRQEESCHARAGLWTGSKTWTNKTSCKSRKLEEASGRKQQEARERSRRNHQGHGRRKPAATARSYIGGSEGAFSRLGDASWKSEGNVRHKEQQARGGIHPSVAWFLAASWRPAGASWSASWSYCSFWSVQKATVGIRNSKAQGGICPSVGWCLGRGGGGVLKVRGCNLVIVSCRLRKQR